MLEESIRRSGDILRKFLHKTRAIPSVSNDVVWRFLRPHGNDEFPRGGVQDRIGKRR